MCVYRIGFWLFLTSIILAHGISQAEWVALEARYQSHPLQTIYIDHGSLRRESNVVTVSALIEWKEMQGGRTPTRFYSTTLTKQFDCADKRVRTLTATDFYGHMGTGEIIGGGPHASADRWVGIEPGTINQGLWEVACGKDG